MESCEGLSRIREGKNISNEELRRNAYFPPGAHAATRNAASPEQVVCALVDRNSGLWKTT